jgi:hypothetical protein
MGDSIEHSRVLGLYPTPAASREMNLRVLTARVYEKLAA